MSDAQVRSGLSPFAILRDEFSRLSSAREGAAGWGLIGANLITVGMALGMGWPLRALLWPYLVQNFVIGYYTVRRLLALTSISKVGLTIPDGYSVAATTVALKWFMAIFFALHFGAFNFMYAFFLVAFGGRDSATVSAWWVLLSGATFVLGHHLAWREQVARDREVPPQIGVITLMAYGRIVPMHLIIIFGTLRGGGQVEIVIFGLLKLLVDLVGLRFEERVTRVMERHAAATAAVSKPEG